VSPTAHPCTNKPSGSVWKIGILSWVIGAVNRAFAFFADGDLSAIELSQLVLIFLPFIAWIYLKPESLETESSIVENISTLRYYKLDSDTPQHEAYLRKTEARMLQLEKYHLITQEYFLPIPYLCQIYHLLNLKHLESVHGFSLNNLKVMDVSQFEATALGGTIKFQTVLDSSPNVLSMLRQPVVEVELTLHTPYTIELNIPIYNNKKIAVIFNILPLGDNAHKLFIDMYSNLVFPKPILQLLLHCASCVTLFEDLPYLRKLAKGNLHRRITLEKASNHKTMQLLKRFVDLYGSSLEQPQSIGGVELRPILDSPC
jgi:hypothetical protein